MIFGEGRHNSTALRWGYIPLFGSLIAGAVVALLWTALLLRALFRTLGL
jgi:hypothetical protein